MSMGIPLGILAVAALVGELHWYPHTCTRHTYIHTQNTTHAPTSIVLTVLPCQRMMNMNSTKWLRFKLSPVFVSDLM